jgi:hypothetical protein
LGELSPQVTERALQSFSNDWYGRFALSDLAALGHLSQRERQGSARASMHFAAGSRSAAFIFTIKGGKKEKIPIAFSQSICYAWYVSQDERE